MDKAFRVTREVRMTLEVYVMAEGEEDALARAESRTDWREIDDEILEERAEEVTDE